MLDVLVKPRVVLGGGARVVHVGVGHAFAGQGQDAVARSSRQKLALGVQQLEGVPLLGVVGRRQNEAAVGVQTRHRELHGRGRAQAQVDDVDAGRIQGSANNVADPRPRNAGVTPHHHTGSAFA